MAKGFNPDGLWYEPGSGYSQGVVQPEGRVIHVTGQIPWDSANQIVGKGDPGAQARQCLGNIETVLASVGGVMDDVVSMTIFYTDRAQVPAISAARNEAFAPNRGPVSIYIQAAGLIDPDWLVEMAPIAVIPNERFREPD